MDASVQVLGSSVIEGTVGEKDSANLEEIQHPNSYISAGQKFATDIGIAIVTSGNKSDGRIILGRTLTAIKNENILQKFCSNTSPKSPAKKIPEPYDQPVNINKSRNKRFHKLFKSAPVEDYPIESFSCAFKGDILLHGQLYVSHNWICFYSKIKARGRCIEIPFNKIISITREKLALFIPNAIGIQVADHKYVFGSFMSRDSAYKKLLCLWKHSQEMMLGSDNPALSAETPRDSEASSETDTTEDDVDAGQPMGRVISSVAHLKNDIGTTNSMEPIVGMKQPSLVSRQCINCIDSLNTFYSLSLKLQRIPRTNMLLAVCTILVFFLLLSAMGLTYKILLLQSKLEMETVWIPQSSTKIRERAMSNLYWLQVESHGSIVRHLQSVLEANIQLLEEVHIMLKNLKKSDNKSTLNKSQDVQC